MLNITNLAIQTRLLFPQQDYLDLPHFLPFTCTDHTIHQFTVGGNKVMNIVMILFTYRMKGTIYPVPESTQERQEMLHGVKTRISDLENVSLC